MPDNSNATVPHAGGVLLNYVGGEFADGDKRFDNINPVDGSRINEVSEADRKLVDRAVIAARQTSGSSPTWRKLALPSVSKRRLQMAARR